MSYRFAAGQEPAEEIKRVVCEQIDRAMQELTDENLDRHKGVHQLRKRCKKIRATLRLARPKLGDVYPGENRLFRDLGRQLSQVRDAEAMIETFDSLRDVYKEQLRSRGFQAVRKVLEQRRQALADEQGDLGKQIETTVGTLREAKQRVMAWPLHVEKYRALSPGLQQAYRRGRKARVQAYRQATPEHFHEWRKGVKNHWYQVRLLRQTWPDVMQGYGKALKTLAELLGDDHDLTVFRQTLLAQPEAFGKDADIQVLLGLSEQRQTELRLRAKTLGQRIFAEKSSRFCRRMQRYMAAWQAESRPLALTAASSPSK
jgi:CHAD domain-containing protein